MGSLHDLLPSPKWKAALPKCRQVSIPGQERRGSCSEVLRSREPFWCVLNPDVELTRNPFPVLLESLRADSVGLVVPLVTNPTGCIEDSIRRFPTLTSLASKLLGRDSSRVQVEPHAPAFCVDWVAGMFQLFRSDAFAGLNGFDEGFFLYYEDVDICARLMAKGMKVMVCPSVSIVHDARRDSHRSAKHFRFHLASMTRYFFKRWGRMYVAEPNIPCPDENYEKKPSKVIR